MTSSTTRRTTALFCSVDIGILSETASAAIRSGQYPFASLGVLRTLTHAAGRSANRCGRSPLTLSHAAPPRGTCQTVVTIRLFADLRQVCRTRRADPREDPH